MSIARLLRQAAIAVGAVVALAGLQAAAGVGAVVLGLGRRQHGRRQRPRGRALQPAVPKGEIIVSFSDRRLYYVTKPGEAICLSRSPLRASRAAGRA